MGKTMDERVQFAWDDKSLEVAKAVDEFQASATDAPVTAVITKPGKYRTDDVEADKLGFVVNVVGRGLDGRWYGQGSVGPDSWDDAGNSLRWPHEFGNITGPYIEPQTSCVDAELADHKEALSALVQFFRNEELESWLQTAEEMLGLRNVGGKIVPLEA